MYSIEFYIFSFLVLSAAFLSVFVKHTLYAVFCQIQAVVAISGILADLNAKFVSFALLFMSASSLFVFLMFALIIFDFHKNQQLLPEKSSKISLCFFFLISLETIYFFFKPSWEIKPSLSAFSLNALGNILYLEFGFCVVLFSTLIVSCLVGISALLVRNETALKPEEI